MADHPSLDAIERDVLTEVGVLLGREAGLADAVPDGEPWSPTCRHHGPRHRRMRHREVRMSYGVIGLWCRSCDRTASDVHVPEGWT